MTKLWPETFTDGKTPEEAGRDDAREAMEAAVLHFDTILECAQIASRKYPREDQDKERRAFLAGFLAARQATPTPTV